MSLNPGQTTQDFVFKRKTNINRKLSLYFKNTIIESTLIEKHSKRSRPQSLNIKLPFTRSLKI